jgi:hypothetical protein
MRTKKRRIMKRQRRLLSDFSHAKGIYALA